ncbi:MAG: 50S ribosomal protein L32 [Planctomycetota bacterium]|jgi:large subunit ribosomal protein L32
MAVPKRKKSHARVRTRRSHHALKPPALRACPRCAKPALPHRVCSQCGYYNEKIAIEVEE